MSFADLAADTAAHADPAVPGRFHVALPDRWDYLAPSGGVVMTCALRAALAAIGDPALRLASATAIFASPIQSGALVCDVHTIRRGNTTAQLRVALRHASAKPDDDGGVEVIVTLARERKGPDVRGVAFPAVRSLADSRDSLDDAPSNPHARYRFWQQLEVRIADGEPYWTDAFVAGPARYARWFRYRHAQRDAAGRLDRLALPPLIDTMPSALHRAIGPGSYRVYAPSLDLTVYTIDDTTREWLLVAATLRRARAGWAIADVDVWDDEGRFVAYGAQAMYLHGVAGDPPTVDASKR
jgi:acyl-CoA thioesterase